MSDLILCINFDESKKNEAINWIKKNKEEYCKKLLLYECIFDKKIYENFIKFIVVAPK